MSEPTDELTEKSKGNLKGKDSNEKDFSDFPPGISFTNHCERCGRYGEVRMIYKIMENGKNSSLQNSKNEDKEIIGPFDRMCLYEEKYGSIPPFITQPETSSELFYRLVTHKELPSNGKLFDKFLFKSVLKYLFVLLLLVPVFYFNYISFIPVEGLIPSGFFNFIIANIFTILIVWILVSQNLTKAEEELDNGTETFSTGFMLLPISTLIWVGSVLLGLIFAMIYGVLIGLLPFLLYAWLSDWNNANSFIGQVYKGMRGESGMGDTVSENFELIWNGQTHLLSKSGIHYKYLKNLFLASLLISSLLSLVHHLIMDNYIQYQYFLYYLDVVFIVTVLIFIAVNDDRIVNFTIKFMKPPTDLYDEAIDRYFDVNYEENSLENRKQSWLTSYLSFTSSKNIRNLECIICRSPVTLNSHQFLIQCGDCRVIFHQKHFDSYIRGSEKPALCPVCKSDLEKTKTNIMFSGSKKENQVE